MSADYWPYTDSEIAKIRELLPSGSERAVAQIIEGAKQYAWMSEGRVRRKPNPKREVRKLKDAILDLRRAMSGLSDSAENHLRMHYRQSPAYEQPMQVVDFRDALHRFQIENIAGFEKLPKTAQAGAIGRSFERSLMKRFRTTFEFARYKKSSRGWPAFLSACVEPLQKRHRLPMINPKSWQDKNRKNPARTKPD